MPIFHPTELARWAALAAVLLSPWAWGCVKPAHREILANFLLVTAGMAVLGWAIQKRLPAAGKAALAALGIIFLIGWGVTCNPKAYWEAGLETLVPLKANVEALPGTLDRDASIAWMRLLTGLAGVFLITADMASHRTWRSRLWITLALTGLAVAAFGIFQRVAGAPNIFWAPGLPANKTFFGPFVYHGNAGSFLIIPAAAAAARCYYALSRQSESSVSKFFWSLCTLVIASALAVNTSRGGLLFGYTGLFFLAALLLPLWLQQKPSPAAMVGSLAALAALAAFGFAFGWEASMERLFSAGIIDKGRLASTKAALPAAAEAGPFGFGSGTFYMLFPHYQRLAALPGQVFWKHLHCDPIQAVIEWGWAGTIAWSILLPGALAAGFRRRRRIHPDARQSFLLLSGCLAGLAALLLHSWVDFPLQIPAIMTTVAATTGFLWGLQPTHDPSSQPEEISSARRRVRIRTRRRSIQQDDEPASTPLRAPSRPPSSNRPTSPQPSPEPETTADPAGESVPDSQADPEILPKNPLARPTPRRKGRPPSAST
jgi:hypothetical protein